MPKIPEYFDLNEYVDKIELNNDLLRHIDETSRSFEEYLNILGKITNYSAFSTLYYWLDETQKELISSGKIEEHKFSFSNEELLSSELFFESLQMNNSRIKKIHKFVCEHSNINKGTISGEYRKKQVWVGTIDEYGRPNVYWYGVKPEDVEKFIKNYIDIYKKSGLRPIYSNPFIKSALMHLLLVRIHPFSDGNGRTARIIQNINFTSNINKFYDTKLKLSPLNISNSIYINQITYSKRINSIYFDLDNFDNEAINRFFDFILNMYDEQLYFQKSRIPQLQQSFRTIELLCDDKDKENVAFTKEIKKSKMKNLFKD